MLSDVWKKNVIVGVIFIVSFVRKCVDRVFGLIVLCGCRLFSNLWILCGLMDILLIVGNGLGFLFGVWLVLFVVNKDLNCLLRIFVLVWGLLVMSSN